MAVTWPSVSVRTQDPLAMITGVEVVGLKLFSVFEGDEWVLRPTVRLQHDSIRPRLDASGRGPSSSKLGHGPTRLAARWIGCHLAAVRLAWREGL